MAENFEKIRRARYLARQRGHKIGEFLLSRIETKALRGCLVGICEYCGASAAVASSPPPGSPEIFGEALERDCPGEVFI